MEKSNYNGSEEISNNIGNFTNSEIQQNASGYVGGVVNEINGTQQNSGNYVGGIVNGETPVKENAGSIAGTIDNPGFGGIYTGISGWSGNVNNMTGTETQDGYVGGFISQDTTSNYETSTNLPAKISVWSKVKAFLFQEIDLKQEVTVRLTPKEEKVLTEVHDFLFQEVSFKGIKDFFYRAITGKKKQ